MDASKKFQKYEVGSIAQLIADASKSKKKTKAGTDKEDKMYDSKLCKIFKKNSEEVVKSGLKLPLIPSFSTYVPIMTNSDRGRAEQVTVTPSPSPSRSTFPADVKLKNKDAAAIRIEARNNNKKVLAGSEVTVKIEGSPITTSAPSNKKLKEKARKLKWRNQKREKLKQLKSESSGQNDLDSETKKNNKGKKRQLKVEKADESESDEDDEIVQDIPKAKKTKNDPKLELDSPVPSDEDDEDDETSKPNEDKSEKPKLSTAELNKPKEKKDEHESRTVFVGNVPTKCKKKELKKLFKNCGDIEAVRFRGVTPAKPNALKKIALRKNELHPDRKSMVAYVRFTTKEDAEKAVQEVNGVQFKEHYLSLDMAADSKAGGASKDNKKAVFIGNLHLKTEDDELRDIFTDCGSIHSVRIIRDQATGLGKGFGYVNFETSDAVELALKKSDVVDLRNRTLRISRCVKKLKSNPNSSLNLTSTPSSNTKNPKENGNENKPKSFGGDRLAEIGKLKRKSKGGNIGEKKKASVARQLAGTSRPRPPKRTKRSQGERQRPKSDGGNGNKPSTVTRPQGQGQGQTRGKRPGQSQRKSWNNAKPAHAKKSSGRYFK